MTETTARRTAVTAALVQAVVLILAVLGVLAFFFDVLADLDRQDDLGELGVIPVGAFFVIVGVPVMVLLLVLAAGFVRAAWRVKSGSDAARSALVGLQATLGGLAAVVGVLGWWPAFAVAATAVTGLVALHGLRPRRSVA